MIKTVKIQYEMYSEKAQEEIDSFLTPYREGLRNLPWQSGYQIAIEYKESEKYEPLAVVAWGLCENHFVRVVISIPPDDEIYKSKEIAIS
jgi:hypothetical protein